MMSRLWRVYTSSFWFVPSTIVVFSAVLAIGLIQASTMLSAESLMRFPRLFGAGAEGSRGMLSTIASSMMSVVGITFSMTLVALSLTSSQYSSRVLRNFMASRATQMALGAFVGIFTYCLIVLRTIRGGDEGAFVPALAVLVAVVLALGGVGVLIFFLHHIASSIQASSIIAAVSDETISAVDRVFPQGSGDDEDDGSDFAREDDEGDDALVWHPVAAEIDGYVQHVDETALLDIAESGGSVIRMDRGIGDFVIDGVPLVFISGDRPPTGKTCHAVTRSFAVSRYRTVDEDVGFGINQIVDIALKALSTGVNDTTTAVICIDYLTAILARLAPRRIPDSRRYKDGKLRVIARRPTFDNLLELAFGQIRQSSDGNVAVMVRVLQSLATLSNLARSPHRRVLIRDHAIRISELADRTVPSAHDRDLVQKALLNALAGVEALDASA